MLSDDPDLEAALRLDALADLARPLVMRAFADGATGPLARRVHERLRGLCGGEVMQHLKDTDISAALPVLPAELRAWGRVTDVLRRGCASFEAANGCNYWAALERDPDYAARTAAMIALANRVVVRLMRGAIDWTAYSPLADLGSGDASFLVGLLEAHADLRAVAFDLPGQAALAARRLGSTGPGARLRVVAGDFFHDPIPAAKGYLLKTILHDCDDADVRRLLTRIRDVVPPDGGLLVIEAFPAPNNRYDIGKLLDLNSLVLIGGRDRSIAAYRDLLEATGFGLVRVHQSDNALALIEAVPICG